ncbi:hypothetical protein [Sphingosinicella terrae]|uniref:hypothetical protein n=1 Tax=Sphingosinicella terrae TaxID=2172047 RepID=UPI000E0D675F|nr:hypothetical protein [Sphingosinicella terrae]
MRGWRWIEEGALYGAIALALLAGLAASYGRELEASRTPDRRWWIRRLLIMPLLAIAATALTELLGLSTSLAAFSAAMLSLGGYDALYLVERRWRRALDQFPQRGSGGEASAKD